MANKLKNQISILPENVANQIAAGEVVQRPASVVKELMENSLDSGASEINVLIKNSGKTSIQVIDNGHGINSCLLYTSPSPRDRTRSRMPSSA